MSTMQLIIIGLGITPLVLLTLGCASDSDRPAASGDAGNSVASVQGFEDQVLKAEKPVLVKFHAPWCGACVKLAPTIKQLEGEYAHRAKFVSINVDDGEALAQKYDISGIPAVLVFKDGKQISRIVGAKNANVYRSALDAALKNTPPN